jgi:hypothetical protein
MAPIAMCALAFASLSTPQQLRRKTDKWMIADGQKRRINQFPNAQLFLAKCCVAELATVIAICIFGKNLSRMRRFLLNTLIVVAVSSCGVEIKSVVDRSATRNSYSNPLIVIPYENGVTRNFTDLMKQRIEEKFRADNRKVEILLVEQSRGELKLNSTADIDAKINAAISSDNKDLIVIFKPTQMQFYNGGLQSATYMITATDLNSRKEVWKAQFTSSSSVGPSLFAKKAATTIYEKLKLDKVI